MNTVPGTSRAEGPAEVAPQEPCITQDHPSSTGPALDSSRDGTSIPVDRATARRRLADARVGRLTTVTADQRPHIVPCCFVLHRQTVLSAVDAKPKSTLFLRRLQNLLNNRNASLLVDHYSEDWTTLWWVHVDGTGRVIHEGDAYERALTLLAGKYEVYQSDRPPGPVIALDIERWSTWP